MDFINWTTTFDYSYEFIIGTCYFQNYRITQFLAVISKLASVNNNRYFIFHILESTWRKWNGIFNLKKINSYYLSSEQFTVDFLYCLPNFL